MFSLQEMIGNLHKNIIFKDWQKQHPNTFLSHFFSSLTVDFFTKTPWEIGYFNKKTKKITVFVQLAKDDFSIKPEDDVFKKEMDSVEKLNTNFITVSFEDAAKICQAKLSEFFPNERLGDGFIVIQTLNGNILWNFSFITKTLKFVNVKVNAKTGKVQDHQEINLLQK